MTDSAIDVVGLEDQRLTFDEEVELNEAEPQAAPISYSGTDFDVEGLVRRVQRKDIVVLT